MGCRNSGGSGRAGLGQAGGKGWTSALGSGSFSIRMELLMVWPTQSRERIQPVGQQDSEVSGWG